MSDNNQRRKAAMQSLDKTIKSRDRAEKMKPLGVVTAAAVAIVVIVGGIVFATKYTGNEHKQDQAASQSTTTATPEARPLTMKRAKALGDTVTCKYDKNGEAAKEVSLPKTEQVSAKGTVKVKLTTNEGDVDMELDRAASPCTVNAITHLAESGYYNNTVCHRLTTAGIKVLQCGDPTGTGSGGPGFKFADEYPVDEASGAAAEQPVNYPRGSIAMANSGEGTNGSQFFLNWGESPLPPKYTYFGKVSDKGLEVLDKIAKNGVEGGQGDGKPAKEVKIESATVTG